MPSEGNELFSFHENIKCILSKANNRSKIIAKNLGVVYSCLVQILKKDQII